MMNKTSESRNRIELFFFFKGLVQAAKKLRSCGRVNVVCVAEAVTAESAVGLMFEGLLSFGSSMIT